MQALTNATNEDSDFETEVEQLTVLDTRELIERAWGTADLNPLMVALVDRLECYADEIGHMEDELCAAGRMPRKQPGKVVDLLTRRTLAQE